MACVLVKQAKSTYGYYPTLCAHESSEVIVLKILHEARLLSELRNPNTVCVPLLPIVFRSFLVLVLERCFLFIKQSLMTPAMINITH